MAAFCTLMLFGKRLGMGLAFCGLFLCTVSVFAQARGKNRTPKKPAAAAAPKPTPEISTPEPTPQPPKRNERPINIAKQTPEPVKINQKIVDPVYRYEFTQPDFIVSKIVIEHDETGKGTIWFSKRGNEEMIDDPVQLSAATLEKLNSAFTALDFVNSTESYQFERDFSNMGNVSIRLKKDGKERTAKYNWTTNKDAKFLMDEYRRIANQYIWIFDVTLARDNQPLEAPKLFDTLDSLMRRNEIADPTQMVPFLQKLSSDERIPLIGRNHAERLIKRIEKEKN